MASPAIRLPLQHQAVLDRFVAACQADDRVVAAFLGGSYAAGTADPFSDLDLYLITTREGFDSFYAQREAFLQRLGEPLFIEDFDTPNIVFFILANGAEGELGFGREDQFDDIHSGPYRVLLDKKGILTGAAFPYRQPGLDEQTETLRRLIFWFWHDLSHFITALGRGQLWWAQGQLEILRGVCVGLARLQQDFSDGDAGDDVYFKLEKVVPAEQLSALQATFCPMDADQMLRSGLELVRLYKELAIPLAKAHGLTYPQALERVMVRRLKTKLSFMRGERSRAARGISGLTVRCGIPGE